MYSVSDRFLIHTNRSGRRKVVADLYYGVGNIAPLASNLPVVSGSITYDRKARNRGFGSIQLASESIDWTILDPFGTELVIKMGIVYPDGEEELVPMGRFRIHDYSWTEGSPVAPVINFFDRSKMFTEVVVVDDDFSGWWASTAVSASVSFCLTSSLGDVPVHFDIPDYRLPGGSVYTSDDWTTLTQIAEAKGGEVWFDRDGELHIGLLPGVDSSTTIDDSVYDFSVGINLLSANRERTRDGAYNGVFVNGASSSNGNKVTAYVYDSSTSLTSYWGPYGKSVKILNLPQITTTAEAYAAAQEELKKTLGLVQGTSFKALLNPALDVGDIVTLFYFNSSVEFHQIDSIRINIPGWSMDVTTRSIQYAGDYSQFLDLE